MNESLHEMATFGSMWSMSETKIKPIVYIASPYTKGDACINTHFQCKIFDQLMNDGVVFPFIPLLTHFQHTVFPRSYKDWIEYDLALLERFDACIRLDAVNEGLGYNVSESSGADGEVARFKEMGKPVFHSVEECYKWVDAVKIQFNTNLKFDLQPDPHGVFLENGEIYSTLGESEKIIPHHEELAKKRVNTGESARESVEKNPNKAGILPLCSAKRKEYPIFSGLIAYFPDACAAVAHQSYLGNEKHNPGMKLHWSRETSNDHLDCIARHMVDQLDTDLDPIEEKTAAAWRALAELQLAIEENKQRKEGSRQAQERNNQTPAIV